MSAEAVAWSEESSDAELITAARGGDPEAFGALYERHSAAARTVARQYTRSSADAEDVVSDAFARVLSIIRGGGGPDVAFRAYLFTVVRRLAQGRTEAGRRVQPTDDMATFESAFGGTVGGVDDPALAGFERGVVARAYSALPERWQAVLWYTEIERLSPAKVAPLLGLTANGVAALAYRAREGLREAYLQQHLVAAPSEGCRTVNAKLGAYVRGGLAKRESAHVRAHLETCADCRNLVLELGDVNHGLRGIIAPLVLGVAGLGALTAPLPVGVLASVGAGGAGGGAAAGTAAAGTGAAGTGAGAGAGAAGATAGTAAAGTAGAGTVAGAGVGTAATGGTAAATSGGALAGAGAGAGAGATGSVAAGGAGAVGTTGALGAGTTAVGAGASGALAGAHVVTGAAAGSAAGSTAVGAASAVTLGTSGTSGAVGAGSLAGAGLSGAVLGSSAVGATTATAAGATALTTAAGVATASGATALGVAGSSGAGMVAGGIGGLIAAIPGGVAGAVTAGVVGVSLAVGGALAEDPPSRASTPSVQAPADRGRVDGDVGAAPDRSTASNPLLGGPALPLEVPPVESPAVSRAQPGAPADVLSVLAPTAPNTARPAASGDGAGPRPGESRPDVASRPGAGPTPVTLVAEAPGVVVLLPGTQVTVSISVRNTGSTDATDLRAALELPAGVELAGGAGPDGWQPCADAPVDLCLPSLPGGSSAPLSVAVLVAEDAPSGPAPIALRVAAGGASLGTLSVPAAVPAASADLTVAGPDVVALVADVPRSLAVAVANRGRLSAHDVTATVTLPAGVRWVEDPAGTAPWACGAGGPGVVCRLPELAGRAPGQGSGRTDLTLTVVADAALADAGGVRVVVTVADGGGAGTARSHDVALEVRSVAPGRPPVDRPAGTPNGGTPNGGTPNGGTPNGGTPGGGAPGGGTPGGGAPGGAPGGGTPDTRTPGGGAPGGVTPGGGTPDGADVGRPDRPDLPGRPDAPGRSDDAPGRADR